MFATYLPCWQKIFVEQLGSFVAGNILYMIGEGLLFLYILLPNNYSKTLWLQWMLLLRLWILWVGNLDRTQRGQLVSVPQSLRPYLGTRKDWGWLGGRGQNPSKALLTGMLVINAGCQRGPQLLTWDCWPECTYVATWVSSQHGSEIPRGLRGSSLVTWPQKSHHVTCAIVRNPPRFSWGEPGPQLATGGMPNHVGWETLM